MSGPETFPKWTIWVWIWNVPDSKFYDFDPKIDGVCCGAFLAGAFFLFFYVSWLEKEHILFFVENERDAH